MRAIRYYGPGDVRLDDIPEPVVARAKSRSSGVSTWSATCADTARAVCGSDLHFYHEGMQGASSTATELHTVTNKTLPFVMGHEFSGTVAELGPNVDITRLSVGQNVTIEPSITCMQPTCLYCATPGTRNLCPRITFLGVSGGGGGLSEYVVVDQVLAHVLPPGTSLEDGAMMEPLAVGWHAVKKANFKAGDTALILGAGPVAILLLKVLRVFQAAWVGVSGRSKTRCELAEQHGASAVFNVAAAGVDVVTETLQATDQRGVDVVFDCGGTQATIDTATHAVRRGGTIMNLALWSKKPVVDMYTLLFKEIVLANSVVYADDHPEMLDALGQGRFGDLSNLVEKGIKALIHEKDQHVKILVHP
ncbi:alcohol dehydrogenase GroES domain protein [Ganoderma leucocontextum]|nr:alcohol dehydrogenase GroES domain protein [Ganoderma leucocontextum]